MNQPSPSDFTPEMVSDPAADSGLLAQAAAVRPDLWPLIAKHPNVDPATAQWITSSQEQAQPARAVDPSLQQMSSGAKQISAGAKDFYSSRIVPAVSQAGSTARRTLTDKEERKNFLTNASQWPLFLMIASCVMGLIALSLPLAVVRAFYMERSLGFFEDESNKTDSMVFVFLFILIIVASLGLIFFRNLLARVILAIVALITGVVVLIDATSALSKLKDAQDSLDGLGSVEGGSGLHLLVAASIVLLVSTLWLAFTLWQARSAKRAAAVSPGASA